MGKLNWIQRFFYWLLEKLARYDCEKGRHRWGYTLSESGIVYMDDDDVPDHLWKCLDCDVRQIDL